MPPGRSAAPFLLANVLMWAVMVTILVIVPDILMRWMSVEIARVFGWAVASGVWVIALQQQWRKRVGPFALFGLQLAIWVSAAILAGWISQLYTF
jgi:hypothetical protein